MLKENTASDSTDFEYEVYSFELVSSFARHAEALRRRDIRIWSF